MRIIFLISGLLLATPAAAGEYVQGYIRDDGTYVQPHYRSSPDSTRLNNYGTAGNYNPYTGRTGTIDPYKQPNPYTGGVNNLSRRRY